MNAPKKVRESYPSRSDTPGPTETTNLRAISLEDGVERQRTEGDGEERKKRISLPLLSCRRGSGFRHGGRQGQSRSDNVIQ